MSRSKKPRKNDRKAGHPRVRRIVDQLRHEGLDDFVPQAQLLPILGRREGWELAVDGSGEVWTYSPSGSTAGSKDGDVQPARIEWLDVRGLPGYLVHPPSDDEGVSPWRRVYPFADALALDVGAIETWTAPVSGDPPGAVNGWRWEEPATGLGEQALEVFDPLMYGRPAATLSQLAGQADGVGRKLMNLREALMGCTTPVDLTVIRDQLDEALRLVVDAERSLTYAHRVIAEDLPLRKQLSKGEPPWVSSTGVNRWLTPKQMKRARRRHDVVPEDQLITYREAVVMADDLIPPLLAKTLAVMDKRILLDKLLDDLLSRPCPGCGAEAGAYCTTASGRIAEVVHAGRRDASPLMREHMELYMEVRQPNEFVPDPEYGRGRPAPWDETLPGV